MVECITTDTSTTNIHLDHRTMTRTSKFFSYILRHGAKKENIAIRPDGFVFLDDILKLDQLKKEKKKIALPEVQAMVS